MGCAASLKKLEDEVEEFAGDKEKMDQLKEGVNSAKEKYDEKKKEDEEKKNEDGDNKKEDDDNKKEDDENKNEDGREDEKRDRKPEKQDPAQKNDSKPAQKSEEKNQPKPETNNQTKSNEVTKPVQQPIKPAENQIKIEPSKEPIKEPNKPALSSNASNSNDFLQSALNAHNTYRAKHGAPALKLAQNLVTMAQNYAQKLADTNTFQHSGAPDVGENLAMMGGGKLTGQSATDMWYNEIKDYNFQKPGFGMNTGHFTQVVWKGTTEGGWGIATNAQGNCYVVGNYSPLGNYEGQFPQNVLQGK